jgi:cytochrome oxidase Cu insertion factor (SCO1/SenC/PrrC family)
VAVNAQPRSLRRVVWVLWALVAALAVAAVVVYLAARPKSDAAPVMPVSDAAAATWPAQRKAAPPFSLKDEHGSAFSLASLRGRPVIVTFIDPLCRELPPARRPTIVAVSVNVYGNAPHILRQDREKWNLSSHWRWGVADERTLSRVWKDYNVQVLVQTKTIAGIEVHQIGHTEAAYVIDGTGHQRALFLWPYDSSGVVRALRGLAPA